MTSVYNICCFAGVGAGFILPNFWVDVKAEGKEA